MSLMVVYKSPKRFAKDEALILDPLNLIIESPHELMYRTSRGYPVEFNPTCPIKQEPEKIGIKRSI